MIGRYAFGPLPVRISDYAYADIFTMTNQLHITKFLREKCFKQKLCPISLIVEAMKVEAEAIHKLALPRPWLQPYKTAG